MAANQSRIIGVVVLQHLQESAALRQIRSITIRSGHVRLRHLARLDERIAAHLDGACTAGTAGLGLAREVLSESTAENLFVSAVLQLTADAQAGLVELASIAEAKPSSASGFFSALGWIELERIRASTQKWLASGHPFQRLGGIVACGMHRMDPGLILTRHLGDSCSEVRARAWRTAGELGRRELVSTAASAALAEKDPECHFWSAWSAVLLGDKQKALERLIELACSPGPFQQRGFQLAIQAMSVGGAHELLQLLAQDSGNARRLIRGAGLAGDPTYVPWLISFMTSDELARLAGEAFSLITGVDLAWIDLERKPPENFESGPNDNPEDPNVDMDEDDGLPWPEQRLVQRWWDANSHRFEVGARYFMGQLLNRENCLRVLKEGYQRQRIAAAMYLSLLNPGTPLFEWRAPAWRQQRQLATMT
jgi:uncharacterized protein (TIGR02270 family)